MHNGAFRGCLRLRSRVMYSVGVWGRTRLNIAAHIPRTYFQIVLPMPGHRRLAARGNPRNQQQDLKIVIDPATDQPDSARCFERCDGVADGHGAVRSIDMRCVLPIMADTIVLRWEMP